MVRLLLDRGADVNVIYPDGSTALHAAARQGYKGIVQLLLEKGADTRVKDDKRLHGILLRGAKRA